MKAIFNIMIALFFASQVGAKDLPYCHDENYPFIVISKDTLRNIPSFEDQEYYSTSASVIFKVNRTDIRQDDPFLKIYRNEILPRINGGHLQLRKVFVRGAASPEGPYENNRRLGRERTRALLRELQRGLEHQYIKTETETSSVTEDYGYLCILMDKAHDADYDKVKRIYDECEGNELCCKKKLMAAEGGKLWNRLLKEYFPQLRAARVVLWFSEPDAEHAPMKVMEMDEIKRLEKKSNDFGIEELNIEWTPAPLKLPRRHLIAVRTNLLHDLFYMPQFGWANATNIQLEYYPLNGHYTYNVGMTWGTHRHWHCQEFFQVRDFQLEARRYFKGGGDFTGLYAGAYAQGNKYGIGLSTQKGWQGEGGGAGLTIGYVMPINRKGSLRLEFMAAAGFYMTLFDPYVYGNPITGTVDGYYYYNYLGSASEFKKRNHTFSWFGPTNLGVQVTYDIIYRRRPHHL